MLLGTKVGDFGRDKQKKIKNKELKKNLPGRGQNEINVPLALSAFTDKGSGGKEKKKTLPGNGEWSVHMPIALLTL